jgi:ABC-type branched-subunit amino acid transport system substrate-binding protein
VVVTDVHDAIAPAVAAAFVKHWKDRHAEPAREWTYAAASKREKVAGEAAKAKADVILLACGAEDFDFFRGRLGGAGAHAALAYGGEDGGVAPARAGAEGGAEVYLATVFAAEKLTERGREFARRYEADTGEPPGLNAAAAYDGTRLLFDAIRRARATAADKVRAELAATERFDTVTGPVTCKDGRVRRPVFVVRVKDGNARVVQTVEPGAE